MANGDFISNDPSGKSDQYGHHAPQKQHTVDSESEQTSSPFASSPVTNTIYNPYTPPPEPDPTKQNYNLISMILGIVSLVGMLCCCGGLGLLPSIISIILACLGRENGKFVGQGKIGLILSIISIALILLVFLFIIVFWLMALMLV